MPDENGIELVLHITAPPEVVYGFFLEPEKFEQWMGQGSRLQLREGGDLEVRYPGGAPPARGSVVEVVENRRIVFTWGYEGGANGLPPGASRVLVELTPVDGGTRLTLRHTGLPTEELEQGHLGGWRHYFGVLAWRAARQALGPVLEDRVDALVDAWNEPEAERRRRLLEGCWEPDALFVDRMGYVPGLDALDAFIANAHRFMPGVRLERTGQIFETHGRVRFPWKLTGPEGDVGAGWHVGKVSADGRFEELAGFWDEVATGVSR